MILWEDIYKAREMYRRQAEAKRVIEELKRKQEERLKRFHINYKVNKTMKERE